MPLTEQKVDVNVSDLMLTPFTSASLINEIIKGLLYQKCQIPFPYSWLKTVVEKRRKKLDAQENNTKRVNYTFENHFRLVSLAFDTLDSIMSGIKREFCESNNIIREVVLVFGSTPNCAKEVFTIHMPSAVKGHIERNHINQLNKHIQKVLRKIFLSQGWMDSIDASLACTNTYIFLKLQDINNDLKNEAFELCGPLHIPSNIKHSRFNILCDARENSHCCDDILIFEESAVKENEIMKPLVSNIEEHFTWCRSKNLLKGFKDCFVDKISPKYYVRKLPGTSFEKRFNKFHALPPYVTQLKRSVITCCENSMRIN